MNNREKRIGQTMSALNALADTLLADRPTKTRRRYRYRIIGGRFDGKEYRSRRFLEDVCRRHGGKVERILS